MCVGCLIERYSTVYSSIKDERLTHANLINSELGHHDKSNGEP